MIINDENIKKVTTGIRAAFAEAYKGVAPVYPQLGVKEVDSTTHAENYAGVIDLADVVEFLGERTAKQLEVFDYYLKNKTYVIQDLEIKREDLEDDRLGIYADAIAGRGRKAAAFPDRLIAQTMLAGFTEKGPDGAVFISANHKVGKGTASNIITGSAAAWFVLAGSDVPAFVLQKRRDFEFDDNTGGDEARDKMRYKFGGSARMNAGYYLWQGVVGSKSALDKTNLNKAIEMQMALKDDIGNPLGVTPKILVVGPSNRATAKELLEAERDAAGATNTNRGALQLIVSPYLP